jgi:mannose-6-phosphate isomerase-like protein (cupin superfamily)
MAVDPSQTYLHLATDLSVREVPVTPTFWQQIDTRTDLHPGRLLMRFTFSEDWPTWEIHPAGDEIVIAVEGEMTLLLDEPGGVRSVHLPAGEAVVVPKGVWHTADVDDRCTALFLTPGEGTQNRAR